MSILTKLVGALIFVGMIVIVLADDTATVGGKSKFVQPVAITYLDANGNPVVVSATHPLPVVPQTPTPTATATNTPTPTPTPTP